MQLTIHGEKTFSSATLWSSISMIRVDSEQLGIFPLSLDLDFKRNFWLLANEISRCKYLIHSEVRYHFNNFIGEDFYQFLGKCTS